MKTTVSPAPATSTNVSPKPTDGLLPDVVLKPGKEGLRFGPVVTGQVALGKDGCGY